MCAAGGAECEGLKLPTWYRNDSIGLNERCRVPVVQQSGGACEEGEAYFSEGDTTMCGYEDLVFDRSVMRTSLIEEYQLLCGR